MYEGELLYPLPNGWSRRDGALSTVLNSMQIAYAAEEDRRISLFESLHESSIRPCETAVHKVTETHTNVLG